jgi:8-oxo-dGTP diphosphatase
VGPVAGNLFRGVRSPLAEAGRDEHAGHTGHTHHAHGAEAVRFCPRCGGRLAGAPLEHGRHPVCPSCGFIWYLDPKVAAGTLPTAGGRVVLVRRAIEPGRGLWTFPGGYMDRGETVEEAAARETREETGLDVAVRELVGVYSYPGSIVVVVVYRAEISAGEPAPGPECLEVEAFLPDEIPWGELAFPSTRDALRDWVAAAGGGRPR